MSLFKSIASAVAGPLVGGLFGGGKTKTTSNVDYVRMARDAREAGFNPLTALRNGGSAGFASSTTQGPALSGNVVANLVSDAVATGFNHQQSKTDVARDNLELDLMRARLEQVRKENSTVRQTNFGYSIPRATVYTGEAENNNPRSSKSPQTNAPAAPLAPKRKRQFDNAGNPITDLKMPGGVMEANEAFGDAEHVETRWGERVSDYYGALVLGADVAQTAWRGIRNLSSRNAINGPFLPAQQRRLAAPVQHKPRLSKSGRKRPATAQ